MMDQALYAGTHFALNVLVARWIPVIEYGGFAIALTIYASLMTLNSAAIIEPMYIGVAARGPGGQEKYMQALLFHQITFGIMAGLALTFAGTQVREPHLGKALLVLGVESPFMLLYGFARAQHYAFKQPWRAAQGSAAYFFITVTLIVVLERTNRINGISALSVLGVSSLVVVAATFLAYQRGTFRLVTSYEDFRSAAVEHLATAKWLVPTFVVGLGINFAPTWVTAYKLGLVASGGVRALVNLALPLGHCLTAASNLLLPGLSRLSGVNSPALRNTVRNVVLTSSAACVLYFVCCTLFRKELEWFLFRGQYGYLTFLIPLFCLLPTAQAAGILYSVALRAMGHSSDFFFSSAVQGTVGILSAFFLIPRFGITGTITSYLLSYGTGSLFMAFLYRWRLNGRDICFHTTDLSHELMADVRANNASIPEYQDSATP